MQVTNIKFKKNNLKKIPKSTRAKLLTCGLIDGIWINE